MQVSQTKSVTDEEIQTIVKNKIRKTRLKSSTISMFATATIWIIVSQISLCENNYRDYTNAFWILHTLFLICSVPFAGVVIFSSRTIETSLTTNPIDETKHLLNNKKLKAKGLQYKLMKKAAYVSFLFFWFLSNTMGLAYLVMYIQCKFGMIWCIVSGTFLLFVDTLLILIVHYLIFYKPKEAKEINATP
jgi:hypothetical protein